MLTGDYHIMCLKIKLTGIRNVLIMLKCTQVPYRILNEIKVIL